MKLFILEFAVIIALLIIILYSLHRTDVSILIIHIKSPWQIFLKILKRENPKK